MRCEEGEARGRMVGETRLDRSESVAREGLESGLARSDDLLNLPEVEDDEEGGSEARGVDVLVDPFLKPRESTPMTRRARIRGVIPHSMAETLASG